MSPLRPVRATVRRAKLWAIARSPSLVGLLYLPPPDRPVAAPRPRVPPTCLKHLDRQALGRGEVWSGGSRLALEPPSDWAVPNPLHRGEEVLALLRLARDDHHPESADLAFRLSAAWMGKNPVGTQPGWDSATLARRLACWTTEKEAETTRSPDSAGTSIR